MTPWYEKARLLAEQQHLTIKTLAERLDLTPGAVGHYLSGRRHPKPGMLRRLAKELHVSVSELVEDDPDFARDDEEREILAILRTIPDDQRGAAKAMLRGLSEHAPEDE